MTAFAGESQAHTKYKYYASKARKEGYVQIGNLFEETSNNEKEHAKIWFKLLHDGDIPATSVNLLDAADGENYEWTDMYAKMAADAREEGLATSLSSLSPWARSREAHEALSQAAGQRRGRHRLQPRRRHDLGVLQLLPMPRLVIGPKAPELFPLWSASIPRPGCSSAPRTA